MKKHLIYLIGALLIVSCNKAPSIEKVQNYSAQRVEELLSEKNNEQVQGKVVEYWLDDNPEPLIYTGHVNQMMYFKGDSIKVYRDVKIKFRDSKYDFCTIEISPVKE